MINYLKGDLAAKDEKQAVIDVGGVGWGVWIPLSTLQALPPVGESVQLHTALIVREDDMQLYGFATTEERDLFELLRGLNGIGARVALDVISYLPLPRLVDAVQNQTPELLTTVPGIGKKRAEKLLFDLQRLNHPLLMARPAASPSDEPPATTSTAQTETSQEAYDALIALGLQPAQAQRALRQALEALGEDAPVTALIKEALRHR